MPAGTPLTVNGHTIGLTGNSGRSTGAHLHIQRIVNGKVVRPVGGGFVLPEPVVVTEVGFKDDIGNYIRLKDGLGEIWSYFHLYETKVKVGDKIGVKMTKEEAAEISKYARLIQHLSEKDALSYAKPDVPYLVENGVKGVIELLKGVYGGKVWQDANYKTVNYKKDVEAAKLQASGVPNLKKVTVYIPEGETL